MRHISLVTEPPVRSASLHFAAGIPGFPQLRSFTLDKLQVQFTNDDTAIIGYEVTEKLVVDGKPLEMTAYDASVWSRVDGEWKCALHTESVKGDPFGRDRMKQAA